MRVDREGRITRSFAGIRISGSSTAGRETFFLVPSLRLAFDMGRAPTDLIPFAHVFLSHGHLDHAAGLAYWASQRRLNGLPGGTVYTVPEAVESWREIVALHEKLEGAKYDVTVRAIPPGEPVVLRNDLAVESFSVPHRVPALGFVASEIRGRLLPGLEELSQEEVRKRASAGEPVARRVSEPLLAYSGDTGPGIFGMAPPAAFRARVFLLECSFVEAEHRQRAAKWGHLHLADIAEHADLFENEVLVLTHLTLRTPPEAIAKELARQLPAKLAARVVPFLPE